MYPVIFVSLGPGEADLITLKSLKTLQQADCIYYPATLTKSGKKMSRSRTVLDELEIDTNKLLPFIVPMSKNREGALHAYKEVAAAIIESYRQSKKIAIVAEGDAGFYSSTHYIYDNLLSEQVEMERIAGVPAFIASGALARIHIVKQEEELTVIPGILSAERLRKKIAENQSVVIMKASQCEKEIKEVLLESVEITYHYFENVGVKDKEFYTSDREKIISREFPYFSLMIIRR